MKVSIRTYGENHKAIEDREVAHNLEDGLLLCTYNVRGADKFRRAAKLGADASSRNHGSSFTAFNECPCIGVCAWPSFNRQ